MKALLIVFLLATAACLVVASCSSATYKSAPFTLASREGTFEIRDYPALTVATTRRGTDNDSFMRLFRYIGGANEKKESISMTTPVLMTGDEMSFVMPAPLQTGAPKPASDDVRIKMLPPRRFAVYRYSGRSIPANERAALAKLTEWLDARHLKHSAEAVVAYYDPPWTLPPLRHNEVMLPLN